jgi:hypothetical protein
MEEVKKGYTCACGEFHPFSAYVFAHYNITLVNECKCGRANKIRNGLAKIGNLPNTACSGRRVGSAKKTVSKRNHSSVKSAGSPRRR